MPSEGGYLETEGIEKTWRVKQDSISKEVDISSARNQYDIVLPGWLLYLYLIFFMIQMLLKIIKVTSHCLNA